MPDTRAANGPTHDPASLEREAFRLAAIVESSEDAIVSKDLSGTVQTWNKAAERMFGYTAQDIVGRPIALIIPPERLAEEDYVLANIRAGHGINHFETVRQRKDGSLTEISLTVSPIKTPEGIVIGASKIARDISDQRRLAQAAEEASRVKDVFLAMLSHELRTPLNAVIGYTQMLQSPGYADHRRERTIQIIERNARLLSQIVSDVLDVSAIVTGKIQIRPAPCNLTAVVAAAVDVIRPAALTKGVALDVAVPVEPVRVLADADRLQQVLWNLLNNAVKFTPRGGQVTVRLNARGDSVELIVADTGAGFTPDALPHLFERFWQGEGRHDTGSLGLGLAIARHFVELHGGTIAGSSEGEGRGATFTVTLPPPVTHHILDSCGPER